MAKKTQDELIEYVFAKADEALPIDANASSEMLGTAYGSIADELENSAIWVINNAPMPILSPIIKKATEHSPGGGQANTPRLVINADLSGFLVLPSDFVRFASLKLNNWAQPIKELIKDTDPLYRRQANTLTRGSFFRPIGVLTSFADYDGAETGAWQNIGLQVEFYSAKTASDTLDHLLYIPKLAAADLPEEIQDAVASLCASRILRSLKEIDGANALENQAMSQLQIDRGTFEKPAN